MNWFTSLSYEKVNMVGHEIGPQVGLRGVWRVPGWRLPLR
jgi:hypothetical protein